MSLPDGAPLAEAIGLLAAGDWQRAHEIVRHDETVLGSWAHGIVHALEGDLDNARHWYRRARRAWPERFDATAELAALAAAREENA